MAKPTGDDLVKMASAMAGKPYIFGYEVRLSDPNPKAFDCSELIEWACYRIGVFIPDGSANQISYASSIDVARGLRTPGAILYKPGHVVISRGDNTTIEAKGRNYGVGFFTAANRGWTRAGLIKGIDYSRVSTPPPSDWVKLARAIENAKRTILRRGDKGPNVMIAQAGINNLSGRGLFVDGVFGQATEIAVRDLQKIFGLTVDGIIGQVTWSAIFYKG